MAWTLRIKLHQKIKSFFQIETAKYMDCLLLPSFKMPRYKNVKKTMGEKWSKTYLKWFLEFQMRWLIFEFSLKFCN